MTTADSPLILCFDLQVASLCITFFDLCGLSPLYTQTVDFAQPDPLTPNPESIASALDVLLEQVKTSSPSLFCRVKAIATTAVVSARAGLHQEVMRTTHAPLPYQTDHAVFLTPLAPRTLSTLSPYERIEPQLRRQHVFPTMTSSNEPFQPAEPSIAGFSAHFYRDLSATATLPSHTIQRFISQVFQVANGPHWHLCAHILPLGTYLDSLLVGQIAL